MINLTTFLWDKFSDYYKENDSYKDGNGKGLLERLLYIFGVELQEELVPKLEGLINELDPETAADEFLSEIAFAVGRPKDILETIPNYRILLTQIISLYKIKGTSKSYKLFFSLLGMSAQVVEFLPKDNIYDNDLIYDDDAGDGNHYDDTACEVGCIDYSIEYDNLPGQVIAPLSVEMQAKVRDWITELLEPIDCRLRDLIYTPAPVEGIPLTFPSDVVVAYADNIDKIFRYHEESPYMIPDPITHWYIWLQYENPSNVERFLVNLDDETFYYIYPVEDLGTIYPPGADLSAFFPSSFNTAVPEESCVITKETKDPIWNVNSVKFFDNDVELVGDQAGYTFGPLSTITSLVGNILQDGAVTWKDEIAVYTSAFTMDMFAKSKTSLKAQIPDSVGTVTSVKIKVNGVEIGSAQDPISGSRIEISATGLYVPYEEYQNADIEFYFYH